MSSTSCNVRKASCLPSNSNIKSASHVSNSASSAANYYSYRNNKIPSELISQSDNSKKMTDSEGLVKKSVHNLQSPKPFELYNSEVSAGMVMPKEDLNVLLKDLEKLEMS
jgi:hypothetical protein